MLFNKFVQSYTDLRTFVMSMYANEESQQRKEKIGKIGVFRVALNLITKARPSAKLIHVKVGFVSIRIKTNFHNKNYA